jgi:hypothetical protein
VYNEPNTQHPTPNTQFTLTSSNKLLFENYKNGNIEVINLNNSSNKCLLLCSGNGLYFPNTDEEYINKIRKQNRYEWENIAKNKIIRKSFSKIIFIRDIYKQWYVTGINSKLNCVDKLVEYLKDETEGYKIIIAGSSAGGYTAVLLGVLLEAFRIITVSGQYNLWPFVDKNPLLEKYKNETTKSRYYDLRELLKFNKTPILYFFPIKCEGDIEQYEFIKDDENILFFRIDSNKHGAGISGTQYPYIFSCEKEEIEKIYSRYREKIINGRKFYYKFSVLIMSYLLLPLKIAKKILLKIINKIK